MTEDKGNQIEGKIYSSHPYPRMKIGRFQFVQSTLKLTDPTEVQEFEKLLDLIESRGTHLRNRIKTISQDALNEFIAAHPVKPEASKGTDSSTHRLAQQALAGREAAEAMAAEEAEKAILTETAQTRNLNIPSETEVPTPGLSQKPPINPIAALMKAAKKD